MRTYSVFTGDEVKKILPDCNVEIKECKFEDLDDSSWMSDDSYDSWDVSFDDGEQDSNAESGDDETNDILDNFDGGEIDLMFSQNYGEDNNENDQFMDNAGDFSEAVMTSDQY